MDKHSNTYHHFQTLLKKWRNGSITASEEQQMHKMAIQDPFLADAWEGYSLEGPHEESIDRLKKLINQKSEKKERKIIPYYWLTRAASLLILVGLAFWIFWPSTNKNLSIAMNDEMVENHSRKKDAAHEAIDIPDFANDEQEIETYIEADFIVENSIKMEPHMSKSESGQGFIEENISLENEIESVEIAEMTSSNIEPDREENNAADIALADEPMDQEVKAMHSEAESKANTSFREQSKPAVPLISEAQAEQVDTIFSTPLLDASMDLLSQTANMAPPATINKTIIGKIFDEFGDPLIGANVIQEKTNQGTITDMEGRFSLTVTDTSKPFQVIYTGYSTKLIPSSKLGQEVKVYLDASDMVLDEILTSSSKNKKENLKNNKAGRASNREVDKNTIVPKGGEKALLKILKKEIIFSADTPKEKKNGTINLGLKFNDEGALESVKILESFNPLFNDQIVRIILEGSKWELSKDQKSGYYTYSFEWK